MKKLLVQLLVFIFSPVINLVQETSAKTLDLLKVQTQLINVTAKRVSIPLLMTARGMVINMISIKKFSFECLWDHVYTLEFDLKIDNASAGKFTFNLDKIAKDAKIESKEDKEVIDFTRKFLLQNSFFTNGDNVKTSIVDYIAESATTLLMRNLPHCEVLFHTDLDVICYSAILNSMKPFYEKEQAKIHAGEQPPVEETTQPNVYPLNSEKEAS